MKQSIQGEQGTSFGNIRANTEYTAVSSEAWAKLRYWASVAGRGRLLLSGSVAHASLKTAVECTLTPTESYFEPPGPYRRVCEVDSLEGVVGLPADGGVEISPQETIFDLHSGPAHLTTWHRVELKHQSHLKV